MLDYYSKQTLIYKKSPQILSTEVQKSIRCTAEYRITSQGFLMLIVVPMTRVLPTKEVMQANVWTVNTLVRSIKIVSVNITRYVCNAIVMQSLVLN